MVQCRFCCGGSSTMPLLASAKLVNQPMSSASSWSTACFPVNGEALNAARILDMNHLAVQMHRAMDCSRPTRRCRSLLEANFFVFQAWHSSSTSAISSWGIETVIFVTETENPNHSSSFIAGVHLLSARTRPSRSASSIM